MEDSVTIPRPTAKSLAMKMAKILGEVKRVPKNGKNTFQNYSYTTEADALDAIRPLLSQYSIAVFFDCLEVTELENNRTQVKCQIELVCGDTGESRISIVFGEARDADKQGKTQDKGLYKAMTGAMKYWLFKTFLMSTGDDVEADAGNHASHSAGLSSVPSSRKVSKPAKPANPLEGQVSELIAHGMENGLEVDRIRALCRKSNLPDTKTGYTNSDQVTTLAQLIEDEIANLAMEAA